MDQWSVSVHAWTSECVCTRIDQWVCQYMPGAVSVSVHAWTSECVCRCIDQWVCQYMHGAVSVSVHAWSSECVCTCMDQCGECVCDQWECLHRGFEEQLHFMSRHCNHVKFLRTKVGVSSLLPMPVPTVLVRVLKSKILVYRSYVLQCHPMSPLLP